MNLTGWTCIDAEVWFALLIERLNKPWSWAPLALLLSSLISLSSTFPSSRVTVALFKDVITVVDTVDASTNAVIAAVLIFFALIIREFQSWYRLSHIPGPFWHSVSTISLSRIFASIRASFWISDTLEKYGPLIRLGPNLVVHANPDTFRQLNGVHSNFFKGGMYIGGKFTEPDTVFSTRDDDYRRDMKAN